MSYEANVDRKNPGCFIFLIDQSGSMADLIAGGEGRTKSQGVSEVINRLLQTIVLRCSKSEGIRDYFDIGVIYYKGSNNVGPGFTGPLAGRDLVPISEVAMNPKEVKEVEKYVGAGEVAKVKLPIWFEPVHDGGTPMCEALRYTHRLLSDWVANHSDSYPPIVINITDGEATDGDPMPSAEKVKSLATSDGNALLFNCHISSVAGSSIVFPDDESKIPQDRFASRLFQMSSELPPKILEEAQKEEGFNVGDQARGFAFNTDISDLVRFLNIGTRINVDR